MEKRRISVIIPSYNSASTIQKALESVSGQTYTNWEVIVVDGLSSDDTVKLVRDFSQTREDRVKCISEKDKGIYDAINKGIHRSTGEWIFVLGSDDAFYTERVLEEVMEKLSSIDKGMAYGNVKVKGKTSWAADGELYGGEFSIHKLVQQNICQQAIFYHRTVFEELGYFNIDYPVCADWDFALRCAAKSEMHYIGVTVCEFNGGGASSAVKKERFIDELALNVYRYFGRKILGKEFSPLGKDFSKLAKDYLNRGKYLQGFLLARAGRRHSANNSAKN